MCGRYTLARSQQELSERFGIEQLFFEFSPRYNIAPTQMLPVVIHDASGKSIQSMRWGLMPGWMKDPFKSKPLINARCETLAEKPAFKTAFSRRRCLVPADGFIEWKQSAAEKGKQPYFIYKADNGILAFAGIYEQWKSESGEIICSYSVITTDANELLKPIHDRMPVILPEQLENDWLNPELKTAAELLPFLRPCPESLLAVRPVSKLLNSIKNDSAQCLEPVEEQLKLF